MNNKHKIAYFAGGCFWGVEYYFQNFPGVKATKVGYMSKNTETFPKVETIKVVYDPKKVSYKKLTQLFFEIHDPTRKNRQGPDIGAKYQSVIFYIDEEQKKIAKELIGLLEKKGLRIETSLEQATKFALAEEYHQKFYKKAGKTPYCHVRTPRFE